MKKASGKRLYFARKIIDYTIVSILFVLLFFIWQLYRGPISAPFLKPYIITALNHDTEASEVTVEAVNIELVRSIKPIRIIARNVLFQQNNDRIKLSAPKVSVSFSIKALLQGVIAPSSIEIMNPSAHIFTSYGVDKEDKASDITYKQIDYYVERFEEFLERFNSPDRTYSESYINDITITDGEFEFHEVDMGRKWALSDFDYKFERHFSSITTEMNASLKLKDKIVSLGIEAEYKNYPNKLQLQAYFSDLIPADIVDVYIDGNTKKDIYEINLPISGKISTMVNFNEFTKYRKDLIRALDRSIEKIKFQLEGGDGNIIFSSEDIESKYNISSFKLEGDVKGGLDKVSVKGADFNLGNQRVSLGVDVSGWGMYLLRDSIKDLKIVINADINELKLDDLYVYWPRYIAPEAWEWCKDSIFGGDAEKARFQFDFGYVENTKKFGFIDISGGTMISNSNLRYINTMPVVNNVYGEFKVHKDSLEIIVDRAMSEGIALDKGYVKIYDLDKHNNYITIKLNASKSPIKNALKLIDNEPLNFASEMGLNNIDIKGEASTELELNFELRKDLGYDDVKVSVISSLKNVTIDKLIEGKTVSADALSLKVNNDGMLITGEAFYEGIPISLVWNEDFRKNRKYQSQYDIKFKADEASFAKLGADLSMLKSPYFNGYADVEAVAIMDMKNNLTVDVKANLAAAELDYSFLGFSKPIDEAGEVTAKLNIKKGNIQSIPKLELKKKDFALSAKVEMDKKGSIKIIDIDNIKNPKTSAKARIELPERDDQSIKINISGNSYSLLEYFENREKLAKADLSGDASETDLNSIPNMDINIAVNSLWTNPDVSVTNFAGNAKIRKGIGLHELHLIGNYDNNRSMSLKVDYNPRQNKEYLLSVDTNHAGNTLRFLRIFNNMRGGNMQINAKKDVNGEYVGHARIRDFSLHGTPPLAKLLTVASFTGMVNLLRGEGMAFSHFDAPFSLRNGILRIDDGKTYGNVMGITFIGAYNLGNDNLTFEGTFAPAYGLNTMIGRIPLIGRLLAGKDGTVFVADYSMTGNASNPNISLNPLSALSPSSLKEVMSSVFGESND